MTGAGDPVADHTVMSSTARWKQRQIQAGSRGVGGWRPCTDAVGLRRVVAHGRPLLALEDAELNAVSSVAAGHGTSRASTLTRCLLPTPPMDGLQLIWPRVSEAVGEQ